MMDFPHGFCYTYMRKTMPAKLTRREELQMTLSERRMAELQELYESLYPGKADAYSALLDTLELRRRERGEALSSLDRKRESDPLWYRGNDLLGMCLYTDAFAGTLRGVKEKLDYLEECGVNYLHLMPFLDTPEGRSDGGYAVKSFRAVRPDLGTMADLEELTGACHERGISVCMDFVMNHTSEDHPWAVRARAGDVEYRGYYYFYDDRTIPDEYEKHVPQVFPTTAPGNFTYLEDIGKYVLTSFYPYQWDLDYSNCAVFNAMTDNMLYLANRGIDVIRIDAVPYIWKELGTDCRNLPQVHTIVRMLRLICEIVCPGVLLLGEVVMAPEKLAPYFGPAQSPECHMLYNATTMCTTWHTVATADTRLLRHQTDAVASLPKEYVFLNYVRCHDDIGWGLDYPYLSRFGMEEVPHKAYLNAFLTGEYPGSFARGERYNDDPTLGDARLCGTTASLLGLEAAEGSGNEDELSLAIRRILTLHAWLLSQSGVPILYSGDEIGQLNDNDYRADPRKADDSRYLHRGAFDWTLAEQRNDPSSVQGRVFHGLRRLEEIRRSNSVFSASADVGTFDAGDDALLGVRRDLDGRELTMVFNFSSDPRHALLGTDGELKVLTRGDTIVSDGTWELAPFDFVWLLKEDAVNGG